MYELYKTRQCTGERRRLELVVFHHLRQVLISTEAKTGTKTAYLKYFSLKKKGFVPKTTLF